MTEEQFNLNWTNPDGTHDGGTSCGIGFTIAWQRGPLTNGRNGAFLLEVLAACKHQLDYCQNSRYACDENQEALDYLELAIATLEARKIRRKQQGILGTHEVDPKS
jgi:hypothetical protein